MLWSLSAGFPFPTSVKDPRTTLALDLKSSVRFLRRGGGENDVRAFHRPCTAYRNPNQTREVVLRQAESPGPRVRKEARGSWF